MRRISLLTSLLKKKEVYELGNNPAYQRKMGWEINQPFYLIFVLERELIVDNYFCIIKQYELFIKF